MQSLRVSMKKKCCNLWSIVYQPFLLSKRGKTLKMQRSIKTSKMQSLRVMEGIRSNTDFMKHLWKSHNFDQSFENYRITAMGQGAGAASVEYLVHSPMIRWRIFWYWFWFCEVWACSTVSKIYGCGNGKLFMFFWTLQVYQCFCCETE